MKEVWINASGQPAIRVALAASIVGGIWVAYLFWFAGPWPADFLRLVPVIWFFMSCTGLVLGIEAALVDNRRWPGLLSILICLLNIPFAAVFALAAMMAD